MRALTLAVAVALLVAGCGGGTPGEPSAAPTTTRPTATSSPLPAPTIEGKPAFFSTPDGNVACDLEPAYARCDVRSHTWTSPKKPADCHNRWGKAVEVAAGTRAAFICWFGASPLGAKRVLRQGQAITVGLMTCRTVSGGVDCGDGGHGFVLTRASYRLS
jgi:hypothetical protein